MRRWTRQRATISQAPKSESLEGSLLASQKLPELPMPRDSQLLTPMSRALLRAARAGCTYIRRVPKTEEEEEREAREEEGGGEEVVKAYERTFRSSKWGAIPRHLEPPEVEFLAKRRTGLVSEGPGNGAAVTTSQAPPMRKTRFKKVDSETGTAVIYDAWVPEGLKVEGEINRNEEVKEEDGTVVTAAPAPGTIVEGVGIVDQEGVVVAEPEASMVSRKRQPPPPKRKAKGPGRGRKKKVMFAPGEGVEVSQSNGTVAGTPGTSACQEEEDEEDEEGEESGAEDSMVLDTKSPATTDTPAATEPGQTPREGANTEPQNEGSGASKQDKSSSPDVPLAEANRDVGTAASDDTQSVPAPVETLPQGQPDPNPPQPTRPDEPEVPPAPTTASEPSATQPPTTQPDPAPPSTSTTQPPSQPAPAPAPAQHGTTITNANTVHFEDGEVDLLGSLEASLDRQANQPATWASSQDQGQGQGQEKPASGSGENPEQSGRT